jgi:hypothetical protein
MSQVAAVLAALGVPLLLVVGRRRAALGGLALLIVAEGMLAESGRSLHLTGPRAVLGVIAILALGAFALLLVHMPVLVPPLVLIAAPFRLPLNVGRGHLVSIAHSGQLGRLLLLYVVLAAAATALAYNLLRGAQMRPLPRAMAVPAAAFLAFASLSLLWSDTLVAGRGLLEFFLIPFAVLVTVVSQAPLPEWMPRVLGIITVALVSVFAVVGLVEAATHRLLFYSPGVQISNAYSSYFRVTSLFRDPSLYGRHVVLGLAVLLVALWYRRASFVLLAFLIALLFAGLFVSYSQSSFAALFAVIIGVTLVAGDRAVRSIVAVAAVVAVLAGAGFVASKVAHASTRSATSDRSRRVEVTAKVFVHHPLAGVGLGENAHAGQRLSSEGGPPTLYVSHTTPLTVAAELGVIGFVLYVWLLVGAARVLERVRRVDPAFGLALAAVFFALFVHSLFYAGFFEDPVMWLILGLVACACANREAPSTQ